MMSLPARHIERYHDDFLSLQVHRAIMAYQVLLSWVCLGIPDDEFAKTRFPLLLNFHQHIQACQRLADLLGDEYRPHELSLYLRRIGRRKEYKDMPRFVPKDSRAL